MTERTHVLFEKSDNVAVITLNRPEKLNAFAGNMREELLDAVETAGADREVRVLVITGAGKAFCAGGDVNELAAGNNAKPAATTERHTMSKIVLAISFMEKPVIASVNGVAVGGGCNLALACDIRIASARAKFGQAFTKRGVHPDWGGIYFLPRAVGYAKAAELIFSGDLIDAREALRIGLANREVPHDSLWAETQELAKRIAGNAPVPIALAKRGLRRFYEMDLAQAVDYEAFALSVCGNSEDAREGFKAFLEKRTPKFLGK